MSNVKPQMMRAFAIALTLLLVTTVSGECQVPPTEQLPHWAQDQWKSLSRSRKLEVATWLNPFVWRLDFDGDSKVDVAVLVRSSSGKQGIALLLRNGKNYVLGAGTAFGNGGDDFSWLDTWTVAERGSLQHRYEGKPFRIKTEGLIVIKSESAGGLIHLENGSPTWQQQSD